MKSKKHFIAAFVGTFFMFIANAVLAQVYEVKEGTATFHASTQIERYSGHTNEISGYIDFDNGVVRFIVNVENLDTGNSRRDRKMHEEYLETHIYSQAFFEGSIKSHPEEIGSEPHEISAEGILSIKGVEKELTATGMIRKEDGVLKLNTTFEFLLSDFGIKRPRVLLVRVRDEHTIEIEVILRQKR